MAEPDQTFEDTGPQRLQEYIADHKIDAEIIIPGADTPTVPAAAEALGVRPEQIVKTLVFHGKSGECIVAIVRGTTKVDRRKLSRAAGMRKPRLAPPDLVQELTGFKAGGTPPIGHRESLSTYIDHAVFHEPVVFGGGGEIDAMLRIEPNTILEFTRAEVADISEDE